MPDKEDNPVPPLVIGKVPDVIAPAEKEAKLKVPKAVTSKISETAAQLASTIDVPFVAVKSVPATSLTPLR